MYSHSSKIFSYVAIGSLTSDKQKIFFKNISEEK